MEKILEVNSLSYHYGAIHALKNISLIVNKGEIVALIGGNGAGKTTTLRCISGLIGNPSSGDILYKGESIVRKRAESIAMNGISQVLEGRHIFSKLTVEENLRMGSFGKEANFKDSLEYVYSLFPRLKERYKQLGGTLSGGEQQMLAVGRGLMSKPQILMMDEPSLGLAPIIVKELFETIEQINKNGTTILLVEQNSKAALNIANRAYVMETGNIILSDDAKTLMQNEQIRKSYLGES